jgi:DNA-binding transcriptional MerR regulator
MEVITSLPGLKGGPRKKLFYKIQEVGRMTDLKPHVLRYWESEFKELRPDKDDADQRRYRLGDIEVVLAIQKLLYVERFTIEGARKRLKDELRRMRNPENNKDRKAAKKKTTATTQIKATPVQADMFAAPESELDSKSMKRVGQTLSNLRSEVNDLLQLVS